jgi:ABC-type transport system involved in multi-copper enzyme maturation permease subunit
MSGSIDLRALGAFFFRELHAALLNRFIYFFCGICMLTGLVPLIAEPGEDITETATYTLLQASLYILPLFAMLTGVGAAQSDTEEQPFLMSQPIGRGVRVLGKFAALWLIIAVAVVSLVVPSALAGSDPRTSLRLWLDATASGGVFASLGLAIGFSTSDRVKAHMIGLCVWLLLLAGFDLLALAAAQLMVTQDLPQLWLALLMLNPLDSLRVGMLFSLERVPMDLLHVPALARWWIKNPMVSVVAVCVSWMALALFWCRRRLERMEA